MNEDTFTFDGSDGQSIHVYRWTGDGTPRAIVQLAHGMGEHAARYRRFAEALTDAGYVVYANDHRGHGRTAGGPEHYGELGPAGWAGLVADIGTLGKRAREEHPDTSLILFGHSMGSFALQQFLIGHSGDVDAAVLSGTSALDVIGAGIDPDAEIRRVGAAHDVPGIRELVDRAAPRQPFVGNPDAERHREHGELAQVACERVAVGGGVRRR